MVGEFLLGEDQLMRKSLVTIGSPVTSGFCIRVVSASCNLIVVCVK
jgi:hypothetical protein